MIFVKVWVVSVIVKHNDLNFTPCGNGLSFVLLTSFMGWVRLLPSRAAFMSFADVRLIKPIMREKDYICKVHFNMHIENTLCKYNTIFINNSQKLSDRAL